MKSLVAAWLVVLVLLSGCVDPFRRYPQVALGRHLSVARDGGHDYQYERDDGRVFRFSPDGLVDAVHGNPAAEAKAQKYRRQRVHGFRLLVGGGIVALVAIPAAGVMANNDHDGGAVALGIIGAAAFLAEMYGCVVLYDSEQYRAEAVDLVNLAPAVPPETSQVKLPGQR